jgi:AcrR family transcriptional regulator
MDSATLHYCFPTKEALIQGVVQYLIEDLRSSRAAPGKHESALALLRAEFADIRLRLKQSPEQLAVLTELAVVPGAIRPLPACFNTWTMAGEAI